MTGQRSSLHVVDVEAARHTVAFARRGWSTQPVLSRDGARLAFTTTAAVGRKPFGLAGVVLCELRTGAPPRLLSSHPRARAGAPARRRAGGDGGAHEH